MADARPLTLMAVHAHPDDEAIFTGGILARYADEGLTTVLVTCTRGELGYGAAAAEPGQPGHDEAAVAAVRADELAASCAVLGVTHAEQLGYHDSGMMGWSENDAPAAFWNVPVAEAADRLAGLIERYRPQVVVTYDADGFYGHPDHIQAHRVTVAAVEATGIPDKLYFAVLPKSRLVGLPDLLGAAGFEVPEFVEDGLIPGTDDELVAAYVDCSAVVRRKYDSLAAHASQVDNAFFLSLGPDLFAQMFSTEAFVRGRDTSGSPVPESDLFAWLR
ncbi:MAG TPA: PIG-L family deacetylase [Acidimicrobiales bacterium]|nr:PIG-L family deacetylase [Acidimicrobiales bacterium]